MLSDDIQELLDYVSTLEYYEPSKDKRELLILSSQIENTIFLARKLRTKIREEMYEEKDDS